MTPQVIVCAAVRHKKTGQIICGARHYDPIMRGCMNAEGFPFWANTDQGFIDQRGQFLSREEAWVVADKMGQIRRPYMCETDYSSQLPAGAAEKLTKLGHPVGMLFSEHLY
jgi:hypothetical protein